MFEKNIVLIDETGVEQKFELLATFGLDDFDYAALVPIDKDMEENIYILRIKEDDKGGVILVGIEDDEELNDAIVVYESLVKENTK